MITAAILTLSDKGSRGEREDLSGAAIADILKSIDAVVAHYDILPDEKSMIKEKLIESVELEIDDSTAKRSARHFR